MAEGIKSPSVHSIALQLPVSMQNQPLNNYQYFSASILLYTDYLHLDDIPPLYHSQVIAPLLIVGFICRIALK